MKQIHTFDEVFDSQKVFRLLLEAMANPGRVVSIAEQQRKLFGGQPGFLAVAMTLLDGSVSFHTFDNTELDEEILLLTHGRCQSVEQADYLFATSADQVQYGISRAKCGTLEDPHKNATLIILLEETQPCHTLRLQGPGVDGSILIEVSDTVVQALLQRDEQQYEYPMGIDLVFLNSAGELWCVPRLVKGEVV